MVGHRRRRREERGATTAIIAMLLSGVLVVSAAFAVDLGQQRVVRSDMQAIADVVALDMVRLLNGGTADSYGCNGGSCALETAKNKSIARNNSALGGELEHGDLTWDFVKSVAGEWTTIAKDASDEVPTAIKVYATSDTPFAFAGVVGIARGGATRSAVAQAESFACVGIGSYAAALDSSGATLLNPILGDILGSDVNLQAIGYNGLADAEISLLDLLEVPGITVAGTDNLADIQPISLADLMIASASVLRKNREPTLPATEYCASKPVARGRTGFAGTWPVPTASWASNSAVVPLACGSRTSADTDADAGPAVAEPDPPPPPVDAQAASSTSERGWKRRTVEVASAVCISVTRRRRSCPTRRTSRHLTCRRDGLVGPTILAQTSNCSAGAR